MSVRKVVVGILLEQNVKVISNAITSFKWLNNTKILPKEIQYDSKKHLLESLKDVEILITDPFLCKNAFVDIPNTCKWVQCTWAGLDSIIRNFDSEIQDFHPTFITTRMGGCYGQLMKEFVLGAIISLERNFKTQFVAQKWMQTELLKHPYRTFDKLTVGIIGAGDIGLEIASYLKLAGIKVHGFKRTPFADGKEYPIDRLYLDGDLDGLLSSCDYICNVLPSTSKTIGMLSGDRLKACSERKPGFINIGRGDIIDDQSLIHALNQGWLSSAFLDVFNQEPLPESSPFWKMPNVTITQHVSGVFNSDMIGKTFEENLFLYLNNKPLKYVFDWQLGY